jgi:hypothetical protein
LLDQEFAGVRRRLLSGGVDDGDGVDRNGKGCERSCFFFGAVSRPILGIAIS